MFFFDKKVIVKRYAETLGEYNRPVRSLETVGEFDCTFSAAEDNTNQLQPQKENRTRGTLYTDKECDIRLGDILYIYELDEYDEIIPETEYKVIADKPYKKRTHLETSFMVDEEV